MRKEHACIKTDLTGYHSWQLSLRCMLQQIEFKGIIEKFVVECKVSKSYKIVNPFCTSYTCNSTNHFILYI